MPVVGNRYYNDPTLGQAFSNLAAAFAPPSGADLAGYASAAAKKAEAARLAELFSYAKNPDFDQTTFDRLGVGAGVYAPSQSYYSVDQGNLTSRQNNAADNARALEVARLDQTGQTARALLNPVGVGETRFVPPAIADLYSLPETQIGAVNVGQGEQTTLPDGRVISGPPKPMTETELKAAILGGLPAADQQAAVLADIPVETIMRDGTPTVVRRNDAVGQPALPPNMGAPETQNYRTPDGKVGAAVFDRVRNTWIDTATNQPLPAGSITFNSSLQGGAAETGLAPTTANNTLANSQDAQITQALNTLDIYEDLIRNNPGAIGLVGLIRGTAQNAVATANDLAAAFGKSAPQVQEAAEDIRQGLSSVAPELFDPSIPEASFLQGTLAYAIARTENPSGEVSRQAYDRALERISGGLLANSQSALAAIDTYRKVLEAQRSGVSTLRNPGSARTDTSFRDPNADLPVVNTPEEAAALPKGTKFKDPQGNIRTVP